MIYQYRGLIYKSMKNTNYGLLYSPFYIQIMDYIEDHKNIE